MQACQNLLKSESGINSSHLLVASDNNFTGNSTAPLETTYVPLVIYPLLLLICSAGNTLNVLVLSRVGKIRVKELLLIALALSDIMIMWMALPRYIDQHGTAFGLPNKRHYPSFLLNTYGFFTWLQYSFYYTSDWILVLFSCERMAAFHYSNFHGRIRSRLTSCGLLLILVVLVSALICLEHLIWYYYWLAYGYQSPDGTSSINPYVQPPWLSHWDSVQKKADIILPTLTALTLLAINLLLLLYLKKRMGFSDSFRRSAIRSRSSYDSQRSWSYSRPGTSENGSGRSERVNTTINMDVLLVGCVGLYFFTQFPAVIFNILDYLSSYPHCQFHHDTITVFHQIQPIISTLSLVNYSANFFVYAGLNRKYRQLSMDLLCSGGREARRRLHSLSSTLPPETAAVPLLRFDMLQRSSLSQRQQPLYPFSSTSTCRSTLSSLASKESTRSSDFPSPFQY